MVNKFGSSGVSMKDICKEVEGVVSDVDGLEGKRTLWMCRKLVFLVSLFQYVLQMSFVGGA